MTDHDLSEVISLLRRPLQYASGLPEGRLRVLPALGKTLNDILEKHCSSEPRLQGFKSSLEDLDRLRGKERKEKIAGLLRMLDSIEGGGAEKPAPQPEAPDPRTQEYIQDLDTPVQYVKGVGPRMAERFGKLGIDTVEDLLYHLPYRYEDRRGMKRIKDIGPGEKATVLAEVMVAGPAPSRRGRRRFNMMLSDGAGYITAKWFKYYGDQLERFKPGCRVIASGVVREYKNELEMHHPDIELISADEMKDEAAVSGIMPVYPLTEGVFQKHIRRVIQNALKTFGPGVPEFLPQDVRDKRSLPGILESLTRVHSPPHDEDAEEFNSHRSQAHRRLAYEELFLLETGLALRKRGAIEEPSVPVEAQGGLLEEFRRSLPFTLTPSQDKVAGEVLADMAKDSPMNRLLQGDVGSGKTVVALFAALAAIEAGFQVAMMAPTEVLAEQHFRVVSEMLSRVGVNCALLTGSVLGKDRERVLSGIKSASIPMVVGTHAVIQEKVSFKNLALGIIDEQHRFGVIQRARLKAKGPQEKTPHALVMTATPIPRSLAMTVYGDLAVSVIREMPPGRKPVATKLYREKDREKVYDLVRSEVRDGHQAFVVYPLVEESDKLELKDAKSMARHFRLEVFPDLEVGLVHGRMRSADKDRVMRSFQKGDVQVLVATTVVEVGIDVPNASIMVVEEADRFGLSQLHQLRGRVGRSEHPCKCCLVCAYVRSEDAWQRLKVMEKTTDGFKIAEEDLAIRGPGEFFGTRQWGLPDFRVANIIRDADIVTEAREDAFNMVKNDPRLQSPEHGLLMLMLKRRWGKKLKLGSVG